MRWRSVDRRQTEDVGVAAGVEGAPGVAGPRRHQEQLDVGPVADDPRRGRRPARPVPAVRPVSCPIRFFFFLPNFSLSLFLPVCFLSFSASNIVSTSHDFLVYFKELT